MRSVRTENCSGEGSSMILTSCLVIALFTFKLSAEPGSLTVPTSPHPMAECCDRVSVKFDEKDAAYEEHPGTYTDYLKHGTYNGRVTYTSIDNRFAITFIGGKWWIQNLSSR